MRSKKREQETGLDKLFGVALTLDQVRERGERIAAKVIHVRSLKRQLKEQSKSIREEIKGCEEVIDALSNVIQAHQENKAQRDLFAHEVPQDEATKALHDVAAAAEGKREPLPTEPHEYREQANTAACSVCGSDRKDGVHVDAVLIAAVSEDEPAGNGNGRAKAYRLKRPAQKAKPARGRRVHA